MEMTPVLGDPAGYREHPVGALVEVLADQGRKQRARLGHQRVELPPVQDPQQGHGVLGQGIDQDLAGGRVVVVTDGFACGRVVVVAADHRAQPGFQVGAGGLEYPPDARADQARGVHRGHRVIQRGRVQDPTAPEQPSLPGGLQGHLKIRSGRVRMTSPFGPTVMRRIPVNVATPTVSGGCGGASGGTGSAAEASASGWWSDGQAGAVRPVDRAGRQ